jgi:hypothetical protein
MRAMSGAAKQIHQPSPGRGNTDPSTKRLKKVNSVEVSAEPPTDVRKPWERRVLFHSMSQAAEEALQAMLIGTRYEGKAAITHKLRGTSITGPLVTANFHTKLCKLQDEDPQVTFGALFQRGRNDFIPMTCSGDHELEAAITASFQS